MIFKSQAVVRGAITFEWKIDGESIPANSLFVDVDLDSKTGGYGGRTKAMKCLDAGVIEKIKHNPFPFVAELTITELATANKERMVVTDIKPIKMGDQVNTDGTLKKAA